MSVYPRRRLLTSGKKQCLPLPLIFPHFVCSCPPVSSRPPPEQARRELRRLKEEARRKHAVAVIWAYWQGLQVPRSPHPRGAAPTQSPTDHSPPHGSIASSATVSFLSSHSDKPVSAHCSHHTSAHDGLVFKNHLAVSAEVTLPPANLLSPKASKLFVARIFRTQ